MDIGEDGVVGVLVLLLVEVAIKKELEYVIIQGLNTMVKIAHQFTKKESSVIKVLVQVTIPGMHRYKNLLKQDN